MSTDKKKPHILIVGQHFWPENFRINDISDYIVDQQAKVDVLCGIPNYPNGQFFTGYSYLKNRKQIHNNVSIRRALEIPRGSNTNFRIFINYLSFPIASLFHLPRLLTKRYDKIFLYSLSPVYMSVTGILLGRIKRIETTMYVLDLWPENLFAVLKIKNKFFINLLTKTSHWFYKKSDKLIVLSESMKRHMIETVGIESSKITIIPQTCEKLYEKDITDSKLQKRFSNSFNIVYAGNISPAQSFETIIEAASVLYRKGFKDISWIILGTGMSAKHTQQLVSEAGLNSIFHFEGMLPKEDIPKYTTIADVLVGCLVKSELLEATIPAKVMSYIAAGQPIVLAMDGEVKDLIENKIECGFVGETENIDLLSSNIKKVYNLTKSQRIAMGHKARVYHFKHFERNTNLSRLYSFIFD